MRNEQLELLKKLMTFDHYNLFDKEEFELWLSESKTVLEVDVFQYGNLNNYKNREQLYREILLKEDVNFDEISKSNSKYLKNVLKNYCLKYLKGAYTEIEFCKALSFFYGNCHMDFFDNLDTNLSKIFWNLHEFTELNKQELKSWKNQIIRECKNLIKEIDEVDSFEN